MTTHRYERRLPGIGPVRRVTGLTDPDDITVFEGLMVELARTRPVIVEMFRDKLIDAHSMLRANREENLASLIPDARTIRPLWESIDRAWESHRKGEATRARYRTAIRKLQRLCPLPAISGGTFTPTSVAHLAQVDWDALAGIYGGSPSDWMALQRALSTFLTLHFGGKRTGRGHPFRLKVLDAIPRKAEQGRVPDISPQLFERMMRIVPDYVRPCYVTMVAAGLRKGEYLALKREHLRPDSYAIEVPGTKTPGSEAVIPVTPEIWPWVEAAVPSPVQYKQLRLHFVRACRALGLSKPGRYTGPRLHDLRHCTGQWATAGGVDEAAVQQYLRHRDPKTTRIYTVQQMRAEVSTVVSRSLLTAGGAS